TSSLHFVSIGRRSGVIVFWYRPMVRGMAPEEFLIILCLHGSKHGWERLKWVADVAELLRSQWINWKRVFSTAAERKCHRMLLLGLALAIGYWRSHFLRTY
ncbi:MAG: nucleotidyltransferase family protein, partial [Nitrospirota bacterium]